MKNKLLLLVIPCLFTLFACSRHHESTGEIISVGIKSAAEAQYFEEKLTSFALENGFTTKTYSQEGGDSRIPSESYDFIYESKPANSYTAISFSSYIFKGNGCLRINLVLDDKRKSELDGLIKKVSDLINAEVQDNRTIYKGTYCGKSPTLGLSIHIAAGGSIAS